MMMITRKGDTGKISQSTNPGNFLFWKKYGTLHELYDIFSYTGCRLSSAPTLNSHGYKCIKPQSSVQYLEHKREFGEPDLCLLNWTTIFHRFSSESDDSNMKISQLVCLERFSQYYGIYWIDNRQLIYVRVWWLRSDDCSALFKTPFNVTGLPTVNALPSTSLCLQSRSGNYAWSSLPLILSSFLPTTLRVLVSIVLQHYRLWYPGLIPLMVTRSPL